MSTEVDMTLAWWCVPYLITLYWFADTMGCSPKDGHVGWVIEKAAKFEIKGD